MVVLGWVYQRDIKKTIRRKMRGDDDDDGPGGLKRRGSQTQQQQLPEQPPARPPGNPKHGNPASKVWDKVQELRNRGKRSRDLLPPPNCGSKK